MIAMDKLGARGSGLPEMQVRPPHQSFSIVNVNLSILVHVVPLLLRYLVNVFDVIYDPFKLCRRYTDIDHFWFCPLFFCKLQFVHEYPPLPLPYTFRPTSSWKRTRTHRRGRRSVIRCAKSASSTRTWPCWPSSSSPSSSTTTSSSTPRGAFFAVFPCFNQKLCAKATKTNVKQLFEDLDTGIYIRSSDRLKLLAKSIWHKDKH